MSKLTAKLSAEDRKMLNKIFLRSFTVFASGAGGAAKAGADGWLYSIMPAINRYYKDDPEKRADAMTRHTTWYNITQNVGTFAMGLVASMERENTLHDDFDTESIDGTKVSLMGPMSGIGDAIFWGCLRVIAAGIGINIAMTGSPLGAILFLLIYNIPSILCRYFMTYLGFTLGTNFISRLYEGGLMRLVTRATSTVGLTMIGARRRERQVHLHHLVPGRGFRSHHAPELSGSDLPRSRSAVPHPLRAVAHAQQERQRERDSRRHHGARHRARPHRRDVRNDSVFVGYR